MIRQHDTPCQGRTRETVDRSATGIGAHPHPGAGTVSEATPQAPLCVDLVYFNAGGGHRAAAQALQAVLHEVQPDWQVRLVDLLRVLDPQDRFRRWIGFAPEAYYNQRLATGFTLGLSQELRVLQAMIRALHPSLVERLARHWRETSPGLVVSLVPNFNRALADSLARQPGRVPFVTVMTDLADHPPNFWIEPAHTGHLVCGTDRAVRQALEQGLPPERVHRVSGMLLRPAFYAPPQGDRAATRRALGLDPSVPTGVVMFGGQGSATMKRIAEALPERPLILMCGHNGALARALDRLPARAPRVVVGYTDDVPGWLRLADYFIGKPGPGSISEALHCGLPVIVSRNAWTMPQERWNTEWILEQRLGIVLPGFSHVREGTYALLGQLPRWRAQVARLRNRALFEVPAILAAVAAGPASPDPAAPKNPAGPARRHPPARSDTPRVTP
jgi:UDP-N-acetylglucosamine:LPS N-acetylglucosamine transferase